MTTQLLTTELANLIQESKRKNNDLRQAAEKSFDELKALGNVNEKEIAEALSRKVNFVNPFIIACGTKNAKFTAIAIVCLQRLIVSRALPRSKLSQALEAFMQASSSGLDVQLKILQALPSLLQNYASDLKGNLLVTALNICFILQSSKNAIVNNTSAATLQQLVVSVFDKVVAEDKTGSDPSAEDGSASKNNDHPLRPAALDAYRIFNDICLLTENQRPEFLKFSGLPQTFGLELIESVISNHAAVFTSHPEQAQILRVRVLPLVISALKSKPSFATTVRLVRILYTLFRRHINILPLECSNAFEALIHLLDQDSVIWKKALCMEVFRGVLADHSLVRRIYALYDSQDGQKNILKTLTASFVRLSTEKPSVIGLGQQSTMPVATSVDASAASSDQAMLEASGVTGIIGAAPGSSEVASTGISTRWSAVRVPCIDQLDKAEAPPIPESYTYSLILTCLSSLSDGLAKFILPLTIPNDTRSRRRTSRQVGGRDSPAPQGDADGPSPRAGLERAASFKRNPVPVNPLSLVDHPLQEDVKICAAIVEECWPAILATCSTFLYAALDTDYYHALVRAFQRFAHVAGLLQLSTPRDAFLTTLGKASVPPHVLTACLNTGQHARSIIPSTPTDSPNTIMNSAKGLLAVDGATPLSPAVDRQRQSPSDMNLATLNTRNLLCLRALLNLGIALGPTLGSAWTILLVTLQQADLVLFTTGKAPGRTPSLSRVPEQQIDNESSSLMVNFSAEVNSVETAASRLIESTVDFPNEAFVEVIQAICVLLETPSHHLNDAEKQSRSPPSSPSRRNPSQHRRVLSFSHQPTTGSIQQDQFALAKIGDIATINIERLLTYPADVSGWESIVSTLIATLDNVSVKPPVRIRAAEALSKFMLQSAGASVGFPEEYRAPIQLRLLESLRKALDQLNREGRQDSVASGATGTDIHKIILDSVKNILEGCGESLINGWEVAFEIIDSVFVMTDAELDKRRGSTAITTTLVTRSSKLIRSSFGSLQLIGSDFLASLPKSCFLILVDTLYKFCTQENDLNIALTTVTYFWALSDFLSGKSDSLEITGDVMQDVTTGDLELIARDAAHDGSDAALWMLLLSRLTTVASDSRLELRNSAIQTLLRIFDAYGERLNAQAWTMCINTLIFKLLTPVEKEVEAAANDEEDGQSHKEWQGSAVVVLKGVSSLLADYLDVLAVHQTFEDLWHNLLDHIATFLSYKSLDISTAAFDALSRLLARVDDDGETVFSGSAIDEAWDLWLRDVPTSSSSRECEQDNQKCLIAYVCTVKELYKLKALRIDAATVGKMLSQLQIALVAESAHAYTADIEHTTSLQNHVLEMMQSIKTNVDGVPSVLIHQVAKVVRMPFDLSLRDKRNAKRTFVATSRASMKVLEHLVITNVADKGVYHSGAMAAALLALCQPITLKYAFPIVTKADQPWIIATSSALMLLKHSLKHIMDAKIPEHVAQELWDIIVSIARGIINADCSKITSKTDTQADENFDIKSFQTLRNLIIPSLGSETVTDTCRQAYIQSLCWVSIIHSPTAADLKLLQSNSERNLADWYKMRPGRTDQVNPTKRTRMAYIALDELFALASPRQQASDSKNTQLYRRLSSVAARMLVLRNGLTLRAYICDQPLRGKMPQPLSQRKELYYTLAESVKLARETMLESSGDGEVPSLGMQHLLKLYPLLVKALKVGGDVKSLGLLREALTIAGSDFERGGST